MKKFALTITLIYLLINGLFGQDSIGFIRIYGLDKKTRNAIVDSFTVTLIDNHISKIHKLKSDSDGCVGIRYITVNKYSVALSVKGYQTLQYNKVIINGIRTTYLTFSLTAVTDIKASRRKRKK